MEEFQRRAIRFRISPPNIFQNNIVKHIILFASKILLDLVMHELYRLAYTVVTYDL